MTKGLSFAVITGLILLSFFGAAVASHESGQTGCLASDLLAATCPVGVGQVGEATFHVDVFLSLFQFVFATAFVLAGLIKLFGLKFFLANYTQLKSYFLNNFLNSGPPLNFNELRWLTFCNHSPTA